MLCLQHLEKYRSESYRSGECPSWRLPRGSRRSIGVLAIDWRHSLLMVPGKTASLCDSILCNQHHAGNRALACIMRAKHQQPVLYLYGGFLVFERKVSRSSADIFQDAEGKSILVIQSRAGQAP